MHADEISNRLPPLRDDEPATLRQNIVDEILDHMHVSLRRELLVNGGDESGARQRVLDKFGNPQEIARRLWFQAMRSRIMTQRIAIGTSVFSVLVCVALVKTVGSCLSLMVSWDMFLLWLCISMPVCAFLGRWMIRRVVFSGPMMA